MSYSSQCADGHLGNLHRWPAAHREGRIIVGWVERSEPHHENARNLVGLAALDPPADHGLARQNAPRGVN